jgi:very-short-patch-repair endonuclease
VILDWTDDRPDRDPIRPTWRVPLPLALAQSFRVVGWDEAVAILDSALHQHLISRPLAQAIVAGAPPEVRGVWSFVDAAAESGIESLVRCRLAARGIACRTQVVIPTIGRVDLLVGDRLVIEVDGRKHHGPERFEGDRRRDLELSVFDLRVVRLSYRQVVHDWDATEDALLRLIERGEHRSADPLFRM